jgi:hypothetical protein
MPIRSQFDDVAIDTLGNAMANIEVTVYSAGTQTNANIYTQRSGGTTKSNPFVTDSSGLVSFWTEAGSYDVLWHDLDIPPRISDRQFTFESVSGATGGIANSQIGDAVNTPGAVQTWVPAWTNLTVGSGTVVARYSQIAKRVQASVIFTFGSGSAISGAPTMTLPVNSLFAGTSYFWPHGIVHYLDAGVNAYFGTAVSSGSVEANKVELRLTNTSTTYASDGGITSTVPFTWATGDKILINLNYEAA